jgi:hypothetical protein
MFLKSMRDVPIGNDDFKSIRENGGYYVDKTKLIAEILSKKNTKAFLIARPRRFGKTLNLSMLDAFFNLRYKGRGEHWFDGLRISSNEAVMSAANGSPVIFMSMKDLDGNDFTVFLNDFRLKIRDACRQFEYLLDWDTRSNMKESFIRLYNGVADTSELKRSIKDISTALCEYHGTGAIILIDEYDNPINRSYGKDVQAEIIAFMRDLLSNALKSNDSLRFGVVTGVMQIAKESIFSGLNNLYTNNVLSTDFDEEYGFTESEVKEMLAYYGHPESFAEVKDWYDGYRFGDAEIYNPWSLINYVANGFKPAPYWAGTSGNDILDTLVDNADEDVWQELTDLGNGAEVKKRIEPTVTMDDVGRGSAIYSVLVMSGYLNAIPSDDSYVLRIPNNETRGVYLKAMSKKLAYDSGWHFERVFTAMRSGDTDKVEAALFDMLSEKIPFFAISRESDYQKILAIAAMCTQGKYITTMESESGNGRVDIKMTSKDAGCPHIIMELKKTDSPDASVWTREADSALKQIRDRKYHHGLIGRTLLYGICFHGKEAKVAMEEVSQS